MALELYITNKGETTCIALLGEFELAGVEQLQARLARFQDDHARPVLDLGRVGVVDAAPSEHGITSGNRPVPGDTRA
jgi:hypothetical protein